MTTLILWLIYSLFLEIHFHVLLYLGTCLIHDSVVLTHLDSIDASCNSIASIEYDARGVLFAGHNVSNGKYVFLQRFMCFSVVCLVSDIHREDLMKLGKCT